MPLSPGQRLGPYEILSPLGAGGMGEVYKARDTRLGRDVAVKVLPAEFAQDPERLRRFEKEARATAALDHPNILAIHDIGTHEGTPYIVEQLLEGESLRQRLQGGPLPPAKVVEFGNHIASGLAAAHEKGIVHRDLKPENLFITKDGRIKILDFGLARLRPEHEAGPLQSQAATADNPTREGRVLGTPGYMAPEQVRGQVADARSDLFAFGVVLYEMLAGKKAFEGATHTDIAAAILAKDPNPLPPVTPAALDRIVRRCLEKRPDDRFGSARDLAFALEALSGPGAAITTPAGGLSVAQPKRWALALGIVAAAAVVTGAVLLALYYVRGKKPAPKPFEEVKVTRLTHGGAAQMWLRGGRIGIRGRAAISRDGHYVAYILTDARGRPGLWVQNVATSSAVQIVPPSEARWTAPTFSPDANYVYFVGWPAKAGSSHLYRVPVLGGMPERLPIEDVDSPITFSPDGSLLAYSCLNSKNLDDLKVANSDGSLQKILVHDTTDSPGSHGPAWSPDGRTIAWPRGEQQEGFVELVDARTGEARSLGGKPWDFLWDLDWMPDSKRLLVNGSQICGKTTGWQFWLVDVPSGLARPITSEVAYYTGLNVSNDGRSVSSIRVDGRCDIWVAPFNEPTHGTQVTFDSDNWTGNEGLKWTPGGGLVYTSLAGGQRDLWYVDKPGGNPRRVTRSQAYEWYQDIAPDGRTIIFLAAGAIWRVDADGSNLMRLTPGPWDFRPLVTKDGRWVIFTSLKPETRTWRVPIEGGKPEPLGATNADRGECFKNFQARAISPEGRRLAGWVVDKRGSTLAVATLAGSGHRIELLEPYLAGREMRWAPDGRSILYGADDRPAIYRKTLDKSPPTVYLDLKNLLHSPYFDISPDGKQITYAHATASCDVVLIQDTTGEEGK